MSTSLNTRRVVPSPLMQQRLSRIVDENERRRNWEQACERHLKLLAWKRRYPALFGALVIPPKPETSRYGKKHLKTVRLSFVEDIQALYGPARKRMNKIHRNRAVAFLCLGVMGLALSSTRSGCAQKPPAPSFQDSTSLSTAHKPTRRPSAPRP